MNNRVNCYMTKPEKEMLSKIQLKTQENVSQLIKRLIMKEYFLYYKEEDQPKSLTL